jgi:F420-dependent oxidoreductase-like protein
MRFCLMVEPQEDMSWEQLVALAVHCEELGFDGLFRSDHVMSLYEPEKRGALDAWTTIAALGAHTSRIRLGALCTPVCMQHPGRLAKVVASADQISGGRVELGLGAGWYEREHRAYGFDFPSIEQRFDRLEETLEVMCGLYADQPFSFMGSSCTIDRGQCLPPAVQRPHPPILIGGRGGRRGAALAARFAAEFNSDRGSPADCRKRFAQVREACAAADRDPESITMSTMALTIVGETVRDFRARLRATEAVTAPGMCPRPSLAGSANAGCVLGTAQQAIEAIGRFAEAGVERIMLQHHLAEDLETPELLARDVLPAFA